MAQSEAQLLDAEKVAGSNPVSATKGSSMSYGMRIKAENRVRVLNEKDSKALRGYLRRKKFYSKRLRRRLWNRGVERSFGEDG